MQSALLRHALMHIRDIVVRNTKNKSALYIYCRAALLLRGTVRVLAARRLGITVLQLEKEK